MAALVVPLAVTMALMLDLDSVWWAGISGFMTVLATGAASLKRGLVRIGGTLVGVVVGLHRRALAALRPSSRSPCSSLAATFLGTVGMVVSPHGMAWLLGTVTVNMVLLAALDDPLQVPHDRVQSAGGSDGRRDRIGPCHQPDRAGRRTPGARRRRPAGGPARTTSGRSRCRACGPAIAVVILLYAWIWLELPRFQQMAITVTVVMAAPGAGGVGLARHAVAERRCIALSAAWSAGCGARLSGAVDHRLPALAGMHRRRHVDLHARPDQPARRRLFGTQAAMVFIVTLVQSAGPPSSLLPGIDRFVGITGGLAMLMVVSVAFWPHHDERHGHV